MLYELCPLCEGKGFLSGIQPEGRSRVCPSCKPLRVVETGLTEAQAEAAVTRAACYEEALRGIADARAEVARQKAADPCVYPDAAFGRLAKALSAANDALRTKGGTRP